MTELRPPFLKKLIDTAVPPAFSGTKNHDCTSVFLLIYHRQRIPYILAILKADTPGYAWRNQVALPGGHIDETDNTPLDAAFRELEEEIGILKCQVAYIGSLGHFQTIQQKDIEVFVGVWEGDRKKLTYDPKEISQILEIPVETLLKTHIEKQFNGRIPGVMELIYPHSDIVVWGVTARIFHYFCEQLLIHPGVSVIPPG
ncbi:MAG: CoA pyrophosphatase [Desulfobacterales bacterium]